MKNKKLILSVIIVAALALTFSSIAKCTIPTVKVAVYFESANIDTNEKQKILEALGVVENRFETQIGAAPDFDDEGTWTSIKNTENPDWIFIHALKVKGVPSGYTAAIFFVDQQMTEEYEWMPGYAKNILACASPVLHACLVRYDGNDDKLRALIQWALSWTFGAKECDEEWCVMNPDYMPYRIYFGPIQIGEDWADNWGPECAQKLRDTYNGGTFTYSGIFWAEVNNGYVTFNIVWTEEYHQWSLTKLETKLLIGHLHLLYRPQVPPSFTDVRIYYKNP